ncbi:MAG: hypothetical protein MMC23_004860 [Stictis urceolatum]|nr:hypothetical protein [Stictis urceolata]
MLQRSMDGSATDLSPPNLEAPKMLATRNNISARHWHNRYMAWQTRERRQREESACLEAEKKRIFGEDDGSGEDEGLCVKMLEYFDGLDFIHGG